jgi:hypothetical protein
MLLAGSRPPSQRARRSFHLDGQLVERLDQVYHVLGLPETLEEDPLELP